MNTVIENNFIELQKRTTHILVEQKVLLSEQEKIDDFLDKINSAKGTHKKLIPDYREVIEVVVSFLEESRSKEDLIIVSESINNVVATTKRLIKSFGDKRFRDCFSNEIKEYKLLLNDINEILMDIENRISNDSEIEDLLANI